VQEIVDRQPVIIVSGLPRSGTSMMMRMLEAGGLQVLTDEIRAADEDNPEGYYEFEAVKQIEHDQTWLPEARGKAVKMVAALLKHLPPNYAYQVIFMQRRMEEILASQRRMLVRRGEPTDTVSDERLAVLFQRHLQQVEAWISEQPNIDALYVEYNRVLQDPIEHAQQINRFLGGALDAEQMARVVDPTLYRQRH
jgi:hypothetical protein